MANSAGSRINPATGKRRDWEAAQAAKKAADPDIEIEEITQRLGLLKRQQKAIAARDKLMDFVKFTSPDPEDPNDVERSRYKDAKHHRAIARVLEEVVSGNIEFLILTAPPRHGKEIADSEPVLTPKGWTTHGQLRVGDEVFGLDGKPARVLAVAAPNVEKVEVEFTNGARVKCHPNHEWTLYDRSRRRWITIETRALMQRALWNGPVGKRGGRATFQLPEMNGVEFPEQQLPMDPYSLGVWLGDGCTGTGRIDMAASDEVVWRRVQAAGFPISSEAPHPTTGVIRVHFGVRKPGVRGPFTEALHQAGVLNHKHIPQQYLLASREQRMQLLAGIMDTDGHVEAATGRCRIGSTEPDMVDGLVELCTSLGFRAGVTMAEPKLSTGGIQGRKRVYTVSFQPTEPLLTSLPRRQVKKIAVRRAIGVRAIREIAPELGRCIQVDRADGLYLVGRGLTPTHNSELVSRRLPAWFAGKFPHQNVVVATYNDDFAMDFGKDVRGIMQSASYKQAFPQVRLQKGGAASNRLQTVQGGLLTFVGVGGTLTGRGSHLLVIDDIISNFEQASSQTMRDKMWDWFVSVAMTRRMGKKLVIITFTRWHADDIIGRLTDPENPKFDAKTAAKIKVINFPAIAEEDDPLGRDIGQPLWPDGPDTYDLDFLEDQRRLDPLKFEALYQQHPSLMDGDLFKRETIKYYGPGTGKDLPDNLRIYCASDHAVSTEQRSDPSVLLKVGVDQNDDIFLLECVWKKMPSDVAVEAMLAMMRGKNKPLRWWAEKGHISKSIGPFLRKRMVETGTFVPITEVTPVASKEQRAQSIAGRVAMGKVYFPKGEWWTEKAINEMMAFPNGVHDDFTDALAHLGNNLPSVHAASRPRAAEKAPAFGTLSWIKENDKYQKQKREREAAGGF